MSRIFSSGYELNTVSNAREWKTLSGSPALNSSIKRSGQFSMRFNAAGVAKYTEVQFDESPGSGFYARIYVYIASAPSAVTTILGFYNGSSFNAGIRLNTNRTLQAVGLSNAAIGSASAALDLNRWYMVEMWASNPSAASGSSISRLDGVTFSSHTSTTPDIDDFDTLRVGVMDGVTADIYIDDVAINDSAGSVQNSFPGEGKIVHLYPDGDTTTNWTPSTGTTHYTLIDEITLNTSDYISSSVSGQVDQVTVENPSVGGIGASDTITLVSLHALFVNNTSSLSAPSFGITDGVNTESATPNAGSSGTYQMNSDHAESSTSDYRPIVTVYDDLGAGSGPITPADVDNYQIVITHQANTNDVRVASTFLQVEYVEAIRVIQQKTGITNNGASTVAATFDRNTTSGNLIVVGIGSGAQDISSITDSQGNTYVKARDGVNWSYNDIWYAKNITGGACTVTVTLAGSTHATVHIYEVTGADTTAPLDVTAYNSGDGSTSNTPTVTSGVTVSSEQIVFVMGSFFQGSGANVFSVGSGYENFSGTNSTPTSGQTVSSGMESKRIIAAAAQTGTFGLSFGTGFWEVALATFKIATAGASTIKTISSVTQATVKTIAGVANASIKKVAGVTNV